MRLNHRNNGRSGVLSKEGASYIANFRVRHAVVVVVAVVVAFRVIVDGRPPMGRAL